MLEKLKQIYNNKLITNVTKFDYNNYYYFYNTTNETVKTAKIYILDGSLSDEDINILDIVIEKFGKMTKSQIVSFMHKERAYIETAPRDVIQFKYAENLQI